MSFRVGGVRARRLRGRGGARKTPKSAADLDAEMEVCTLETYAYLPILRFCLSFRIILPAMVLLSLHK
jgi:hypothetical protein